MVKTNLKVLLCIVIFFHVLPAFGQENRYIVYFTDKSNSSFDIDRPEEFLSERAILRRQKNQVSIADSDLPVNQSYLQQVIANGAEVYHTSKWLNAALITVEEANVAALEVMPIVDGVEFVAPGGLVASRKSTKKKLLGKASDNNNREHSMHAADAQNRMLSVNFMHGLGFRGEGILIGVFDSGFINVDNLAYFNHLFADNRIRHTFNFVGNSENVYTLDDHGTQVLSCMAAFNEGQITGTAPGASYLLYITEDDGSEYRIEEFNWIFAAEKADSAGVDIINTSLGYNTFDDPDMDYSVENMDGQTTIISIGAQMAADKGILLINSAGNLGNDPFWRIVAAPADVKDAISVGSINTDTVRSGFSSTGPTADGRLAPDVVALGAGTVVGFNDVSNSSLRASGTSYATPLVTGLAAGIMQAFPEKTKNDILQMIRDSGHRSNDTDNELGFGIPSFSRARNLVVGLPDAFEKGLNLFPNPVDNQLYLQWQGDHPESFKIQIISQVGQIVYENDRPAFITREPVRINTEYLTPGVYVLKVTNRNNHRQFKFLKN